MCSANRIKVRKVGIKMIKSIAKITCLSLMLFFFTGCAFGTRRVNLKYPPNVELKKQGVAYADETMKPLEKNIYLVKFKDLRTRQDVGEMRNGFGMKTARVIAQNDVVQWVNDSLKYELEKTGYAVTVVDGFPSKTDSIGVYGKVLSVYCTGSFTYEGIVSLTAGFYKEGKEIFTAVYNGEESAGINWAGTSESYEETLELALQNVLRRLVQDINSNYHDSKEY
jgi:uncharacterized lipoprotein